MMQQAGYGAQRLWMGVAWGGGSYVAGAVIDARGYAMIFPWTVGFSAVVAAVVLARPGGPPRAGKAPPGAPAPAPTALGALRAFRDRRRSARCAPSATGARVRLRFDRSCCSWASTESRCRSSRP